MCFIILVITVFDGDAHADDTEVIARTETPLVPGERVAGLRELSSQGQVVLQRLTQRTYWVHSRGYSSLFYVGDRGILLFDPLSGSRHLDLIKAVRTVSDLPLSAVVYSHSHLDHIGDAGALLESLPEDNERPRIIATSRTLEEIERFDLEVPWPDRVVSVPEGQFRFEQVDVRVYTDERYSHSRDSSLFHIESEKVVINVDGINPGYLPYFRFSGSMDPRAFTSMIRQLLALDWSYLNGGHGNVGNRRDAELYLQYLLDVSKSTKEVMRDFDYNRYYGPEMHAYDSFNMLMNNMSDQVMVKLRNKYADHPGLSHVIRSHVESMHRQIVVHGPIE